MWAQYINTNFSDLYCQSVSNDVDNNNDNTDAITDVDDLSTTDNRNIYVLDESNDNNHGDNHDDSCNQTNKDIRDDVDDDDDNDDDNDNDNDDGVDAVAVVMTTILGMP